MELSVVIPTLGRAATLARVLIRLDVQRTLDASFEVIVVADAAEADLAAVDAAVAGRARRLQAERPGASAARNAGWRAARAPVVLFLDDDVLPGQHLIAEHLAAHAEHPAPEVGVLGHVRWADELRVTPFMRWLERGVQFDYGSIQGVDAGWSRFYTANASVKRELLERAGGFDEVRLPFGHEDTDLAIRMREHGFRLVYRREAEAEHLHAMTVTSWQRTVRRLAVSERRFVELHPEMPAALRDRLTAATRWPPLRGRAARLAAVVPRGLPLAGPYVWERADVFWCQQLAGPFFDAWEAEDYARDEA